MDQEKRELRDAGLVYKVGFFLLDIVDKPITWFRETVVEPNRAEYYWYHERPRRVPTIDECYEDDIVCQYEAEYQFQNDRKVDVNILRILKRRHQRCQLDYPDQPEMCQILYDKWDNALTNFFIKYGDLGIKTKAFDCYMKQKHRLAWERRHGPVGTGRKPPKDEYPGAEKSTC